MARHPFVNLGDGDPHCGACGASYHCPACGDGCGMMGHETSDAQGWFAYCVNPERYAAKIAADKFVRDQKDRNEFNRLAKKFGQPTI